MNCPICRGADIQPWFTCRDAHGKWDLLRCCSCGHGFVYPCTPWSQLAVYYSNEYPACQSSVFIPDAERALTIADARFSGEFRHTPVKTGTSLWASGAAQVSSCGSRPIWEFALWESTPVPSLWSVVSLVDWTLCQGRRRTWPGCSLRSVSTLLLSITFLSTCQIPYRVSWILHPSCGVAVGWL